MFPSRTSQHFGHQYSNKSLVFQCVQSINQVSSFKNEWEYENLKLYNINIMVQNDRLLRLQ